MNFQNNFYLGADTDGFELKEKLKKYLGELGVNATDLGVFAKDEEAKEVDYVYIAREVSEKINETHGAGLIISDTGIGMCMVANEKKGIRAALVTNETMAMLARKNNNANLLCLGADFCDEEQAKAIVKVFLETNFDREKHKHFVEKYI